MSAEQEGNLIGNFRLRKEKDGKDFIYEAQLFQHDITMDYKIRRRWNYIDKIDNSPWRESPEWNLDDLNRFNRKLHQKTQMMNYDVVEVQQPQAA